VAGSCEYGDGLSGSGTTDLIFLVSCVFMAFLHSKAMTILRAPVT
jgi:hypothetical protein